MAVLLPEPLGRSGRGSAGGGGAGEGVRGMSEGTGSWSGEEQHRAPGGCGGDSRGDQGSSMPGPAAQAGAAEHPLRAAQPAGSADGGVHVRVSADERGLRGHLVRGGVVVRLRRHKRTR
eukprot:872722-Rhodomonas_salina.1